MKKILENKIVKLILLMIMNIFLIASLFNEFGFSIVLSALFLIITSFILIYVFNNKMFNNIISAIVKYRYLICIIIFIICVVFKVHGSSIGAYDYSFSEKNENKTNVIFGINRIIRTDEWVSMTPYYFSQYYNSYNITSSNKR